MEIEITRGILHGSEESFEHAYHAYRDKLYFYFYKKIKESSVCKDLVQEVFIKLWRYRGSLRTDLALSLQIFRIARTTLIDVLRKKAIHRVHSVPNELLNDMADQAPFSNNEPDLQDHLVYLKQELRSLSPARKKIIEYRLQGFTNQEIASMLSISKRTVENQLNKAFHEIKRNAELPTLLVLLLMKCTL